MVPKNQQVGRVGFPAVVIERQLLSNNDLTVAMHHAATEQAELADSVVALGLVSEADAYASLAEAAGVEFVSLENLPSIRSRSGSSRNGSLACGWSRH